MHPVQVIEENFFAIGRYWGTLNSKILQTQSISAMTTDIPVADLNWAWNEKPLTAQDSINIDIITKHYTQLALPFWWWVYPCGQTSKTRIMLESKGLKFLTAIPCLAIDFNFSPAEKFINPAAIITVVQNTTDLTLWEELSFAGFEFAIDAKTSYHRFVASFDISRQSPQKLFLIYLDGVPVASSLLFINNDTAGIYFVSTLPAYRNNGVGLALTNYVVLYAKKMGLKFCILQSSELGLNVYKQAGFIEYCHADIYSIEQPWKNI
jgi:GNAT superfamily N-acetyltransferase